MMVHYIMPSIIAARELFGHCVNPIHTVNDFGNPLYQISLFCMLCLMSRGSGDKLGDHLIE